MVSLKSAAARTPTLALAGFEKWVRQTALPFWADVGFDRSSGLFEEALGFSGKPLILPHRAMVQARQIYAFAHAALIGWLEEGHTLAEKATSNLLRHFCIEDGDRAAIVFSTDRNGTVLDPSLDTYTQAFVLFALSWMYRLTGEHRYLRLADQISTFIATDIMDSKHHGLLDRAGTTSCGKRQNPLMHLLEAYLAWEDAAPGRGYGERAGALMPLFERFFRGGVIVEHLPRDWGNAGNERWEPGHHYEWGWLLDWHGAVRSTERGRDLCQTAGQYGHAPGGLIYDEISRDKGVTGTSHRLWPHTEAIKAALCGHEGNAADPLAFAETMASQLATHFLARPFAGGWIDRVDADGNAIVDRVPASSLYHLMLAATEAARRAQFLNRSTGGN